MALDGTSGLVDAKTLYYPYGSVRYSSGTMPTSKGFTGQRADASTGLDYYNARYYDPIAGQFTSADSVLPGNGYDAWGLSRYAYVEGNPESRNDPSGHRVCGDDGIYSCTQTTINSAGIAVAIGEGVDGARAAMARFRLQQIRQDYEDAKAAWRESFGSGPIPRATRRLLQRARNAAENDAADAESTAEADAQGAHAFGRLFAIAGGIVDGLDTFGGQWAADSQYSFGMRALRATTAGIVHGALSVGTAYLGSVIGEGVGAVAGTVVGAALLGGIGFLIGGPAGAAIGIDIGADVGDVVGSTVGGMIGSLWVSNQLSSGVANATASVTDGVTNLANSIGSLFS